MFHRNHGGRKRLGREEKQCAEFATHGNFSALHFHVNDHLSGPEIPL